MVKNKVSPPFKTALVDINYNEGIDKYYELIDLAVKYDILAKAGVSYAYKNNKIGQGRECVKEYLKILIFSSFTNILTYLFFLEWIN